MSAIPPAVARLCENPMVVAPAWPGSSSLTGDGYTIWFGPPIYPGLVVVLQIRTVDVDGMVADVRRRLRDRGVHRAGWFAGSSATPADLPERLLALGLRDDDDPLLRGLVLRRPPTGTPGDVTVKRVSSAEDFERFYAIQQSAFEAGDDVTERGRAEVAALHDEEASVPYITTYLAYVDGEPVATARATFADAGVVLNGGSTLHRARGRGAYRALVAARWDDAVARGTPFLTTLARPSSHPILRSMGFEECCDVRSLIDEF